MAAANRLSTVGADFDMSNVVKVDRPEVCMSMSKSTRIPSRAPDSVALLDLLSMILWCSNYESVGRFGG